MAANKPRAGAVRKTSKGPLKGTGGHGRKALEGKGPTPKATEPSERPENKPSYSFNGAVNTTAQGHPVPVGYGRLIVGSAVISAGIDVDEIAA